MSREEVHAYRGLTLNETGEEERKEEIPRKVHIHFFSLSTVPWWKKVLWGAVFAAVLAALFALAWFLLLGGLVAAGALAVVYLLKRFLVK